MRHKEKEHKQAACGGRGFFISRCGLERIVRRGDLAFNAFQSEQREERFV